jgi:CRISPR/Cas system-associated exonuclease Cas4 (RecB family)
VAKYDLVAVGGEERAPDRAIIVDWKTNSKRPSRQWLAERWQTRVYPYLLVRAGAELNDGEPFRPDQVEMIYWFANAPARPERRLISQMEEIAARIEDASGDLVKDERYCRYCRYRSLCGSSADADSPDEAEGDWTESEDFGFEFDFEQIAEVAY